MRVYKFNRYDCASGICQSARDGNKFAIQNAYSRLNFLTNLRI